MTTNGGKAWVIAGSTTRAVGAASLSTTAAAELTGLQSSGELGASVAGVGDIDGDGLQDLGVGADFTDGVQPTSGAVALYAAPSGQLRLDDAFHVIDGGIGGEGFGASLAHGDLDGDGAGDLAVGAQTYGSSEGRVAVFFGGF